MSEDTRLWTNERQDASGEAEGAPDELIHDLAKKQQAMAEAMQRLIRFQRQTLSLKNAASIDETLDAMEQLLVEVVEFSYFSLHSRNDNSPWTVDRQLGPDELVPDCSLLDWAANTQSVSVSPIDHEVPDPALHSTLFLPFGPHHVMVLWLEQPVEAFTQEQETLLTMLSRETASVLEMHHYRSWLENARASMTDIVESVPLGLLAIDTNDILYNLNSTAEVALGILRTEVVGHDYKQVLPQKLVDLLAGITPGKDLDDVDLALERPDGSQQHLGISVTPIQAVDIAQTGRLVIIRDLQLSHEVTKLRELDSMKNDFLSLVTHELRTPLTSIIAYSEALQIDEAADVPPEWREYVSIIHNEGKHLCHLVDNILDLTKMESGKMDYNYETHDVNELITTVVMGMTTEFEKKHHELELELEDELPLCRVASERFAQAFGNVLGNAVKYTDQGGTIAIRSRKADPLPGSGADSVIIEVEDNGIGIAPAQQEKVFSKFEIAEAVENHTLGSGLGLPITKQIIEDGHGGKVWLTSEEGKGTTVYIQIPVA